MTSAAPAERPSGADWINQFAAKLGVRPPTEDEFTDLLALAGVAAHASERIAAPVACWLAATAGISPVDARRIAAAMVEEGQGPGEAQGET